MLRALSGDMHEVYTGVSVIRNGKELLAAERSAVRFRALSDGEIAASIADHWERTFLDPDYRPCLYGGGERAEELAMELPVLKDVLDAMTQTRKP